MNPFKRIKSLIKNMVWVVVRPINTIDQNPIVSNVTSDFYWALKEAKEHGGFVIPAFRHPND